jgi:hypothetical protein
VFDRVVRGKRRMGKQIGWQELVVRLSIVESWWEDPAGLMLDSLQNDHTCSSRVLFSASRCRVSNDGRGSWAGKTIDASNRQGLETCGWKPDPPATTSVAQLVQ